MTGRVVRTAQKNRFCLGVDELLEIIHRRKGECVLQAAGHRNKLNHRRVGKGGDVRIKGFGDDHLVARIAECHQRKEQCFAPAGGNQNILRLDIHSICCVIGGKRVPEALISFAGSIGDDRLVVAPDCFQNDLGSLDIGLADIQVIYGDPPLYG